MKSPDSKRKIKINKALSDIYDKAYKKSAINAMSIAVNLYNCEPNIRTGVFMHMNITSQD